MKAIQNLNDKEKEKKTERWSHATQKMKFFIKDFFGKCDQIRSFTLTEEILNGKLHFLCSVS